MANRQIGWSQESNLLWQIGNQIDRFEKVIFASLSNTVPSSRTLTINGVTYDLSANRTWTISSGISGTIATGQVAFGSALNTVAGSNNLFWDAANLRLGIGTNAPTTTLDIRGKTRIQTSGNCEFDFVDGANIFRIGVSGSGGFVGTLTNLSVAFFSSAIKRGEISINGNFILQNGGTFTDGGQRLQVQGTSLLNGNVTLQGNISSPTFSGDIQAGSSFSFYSSSGSINTILGLTISASSSSGNGVSISRTTNITTNAANFLTINSTSIAFAPTSGSNTLNGIYVPIIINQTGGANGITRGLYIQPTLTAAADWRSVQWDNNTGWGLFGAGTADNFLGGGLLINGVLRETITTNRQTVSYTLALADRGKLVEMNVATANNLTVPLDSAIAFPVGTKIDISQYGAGQTTVVATGGVTIRSAGGALKLALQYSGASLVKIATNEWYLFGDITV